MLQVSDIIRVLIESLGERGRISLKELEERLKFKPLSYRLLLDSVLNRLKGEKLIEIDDEGLYLITSLTHFILKCVELNMIDIEYASTIISWKDFEHLASQILEEMGFETYRNLRVKCEGRTFEVDILAIRGSRALIIDCKHWNLKRGASSKIKRLIPLHVKRANCVISRLLSKPSRAIPVILTLHDVGLRFWGGVFVVPIFTLKDFIHNIELYEEQFKEWNT